jgi:hypothetical protein
MIWACMQWAEPEPNTRNKEMLLSPYAVIHKSCLPRSQTVVRHVAVVKSSYNASPSMSFLDPLITLIPFAFAVSDDACCTTRLRVESCAALRFFPAHIENWTFRLGTSRGRRGTSLSIVDSLEACGRALTPRFLLWLRFARASRVSLAFHSCSCCFLRCARW